MLATAEEKLLADARLGSADGFVIHRRRHNPHPDFRRVPERRLAARIRPLRKHRAVPGFSRAWLLDTGSRRRTLVKSPRDLSWFSHHGMRPLHLVRRARVRV